MSKGKKMPEDELRKEVRKFLDERKELVLCTCSNNIPQLPPLIFTPRRKDLTSMWVSLLGEK